MLRVAVAGGSGYMGAELLRLLLQHPEVTLTAVTSERFAGQALGGDRRQRNLGVLEQKT